MPRLSSSRLLRLHRFLLEIHAAGSTEALCRLVPAGLSKLIACDRAAFNEYGFGAERVVIPFPTPAYWDRFGPILLRHRHEHPLTRPTIPAAHRAVTFGDFAHNPVWRKSTLYHEYYLPVGARQQLSVHSFQTRGTRYLLNCNRWERDFSTEDRAVMEILSCHVACAWRTASALMAWQDVTPATDDKGRRRGRLVLDAEGRTIAPVPAAVREMGRRFFGRPIAERRVLPDMLRRWAIACQATLSSPERLGGSSPASFVQRKNNEILTVRIAQTNPATTTLWFEEQPAEPTTSGASPADLTSREREVLHWLGEGKRNREIAVILGLSPRTVGKHLEHLFQKLGVETRTAAARVGAIAAGPPPAAAN